MIELSEHATIVAEGPAPQQRIEARIRRLLRNKIDLRWLAGDRVEIRASSWIGVVQLPTGQAIRVRPKLAGDELRVLVMLGVVNALPVDEIADLVRDLDDAPQGDARELLTRLAGGPHGASGTGHRPDPCLPTRYRRPALPPWPIGAPPAGVTTPSRHARTWSRALLKHAHLSDLLLAGGSEAPPS